MKKLLTILCLVLLVSCSNEVPSDKLVERQGIKYEINSTTPFTGSSVSYYENGQLMSKHNYKDGERDGLSEWFHDNGQLLDRENYKNREREGLSERFYDNGQLDDKKNYKNGKKEGLTENYHKNGQLSFKGKYKNDEKDGLFEGYYDNGQLHYKDNYINGKLTGPHERYFKNGQLKSRGNYKNNGKFEGIWERYDEKGKDVSNDSYRYYDDSGQLKESGQYINGKHNGYMSYYRLGKKFTTFCFINGKLQTDLSYCSEDTSREDKPRIRRVR